MTLTASSTASSTMGGENCFGPAAAGFSAGRGGASGRNTAVLAPASSSRAAENASMER